MRIRPEEALKLSQRMTMMLESELFYSCHVQVLGNIMEHPSTSNT